jgi:hypothetical protein
MCGGGTRTLPSDQYFKLGMFVTRIIIFQCYVIQKIPLKFKKELLGSEKY